MTTYSLSIVVVILCLLTLTTSASAECAWVLWSQHYDRAPEGVVALGIPSGRWELHSAYPSVAECARAIDSRDALARKNRWTVLREATTKVLLLEMEESREGAEWQCLPDTVDPRAPKGK